MCRLPYRRLKETQETYYMPLDIGSRALEHVTAREYLRELLRVTTRIAVNITVATAATTVIGASYGNLAAATATLVGVMLAYIGAVRLFNLDYGGYETIAATLLVIGVGIIGMAAANTYQPDPFTPTSPQEALKTISTMTRAIAILVQVLDAPRLAKLCYTNMKHGKEE